MPLSIRHAEARAAALLDTLEVGETWNAHEAERAFNFERHWAALIAVAPRGLTAAPLTCDSSIGNAETPRLTTSAGAELLSPEG